MRQFPVMAGISNPYLSQIERGPGEPPEPLGERRDGLQRRRGLVVSCRRVDDAGGLLVVLGCGAGASIRRLIR